MGDIDLEAADESVTTRKRDAGTMIEAAVCYLRTVLTDVHPYSQMAAAPVMEPPADWPLDVVLWRPRFDDPLAMLGEAVGLLALAQDLIAYDSAFETTEPPIEPLTAELARLRSVVAGVQALAQKEDKRARTGFYGPCAGVSCAGCTVGHLVARLRSVLSDTKGDAR